LEGRHSDEAFVRIPSRHWLSGSESSFSRDGVKSPRELIERGAMRSSPREVRREIHFRRALLADAAVVVGVRKLALGQRGTC
jgi:hypothetical protein